MRHSDPHAHAEMTHRVDPDASSEWRLERLDYRLALAGVYVAYLMFYLADPTAEHWQLKVNGQVWMEGISNRIDHPALFALSFVALFIAPLIVAGLVFVARRVARFVRTSRDQLLYRRAIGRIRALSSASIADAPPGTVRVRGAIERVEADPFDARPPAFRVVDWSGAALVDDDCLLLVGVGGELPPDGTLVEVVGGGRPHGDGFIFDGTPRAPITITTAEALAV